MPWWVWVVVGLFLMGTEIFTGGFGVFWFGLAAMGSAVLAALGLGLTWQLGLFGILGLVLLVQTRPLVRRLQARDQPTNVDALAGQTGVVEQVVGDPANPYGYVRIRGEMWRATSTQTLPPGTRVRVRQVQGVTALVEPAGGETPVGGLEPPTAG